MATITKRLGKGILTNVSADLYTVPASTYTVVKALTLCNYTAGAVTVTLALAGTNILYEYSLAAKSTVTIPFMDQVLHAGEKISGLASANTSITYYISGKEVS